MYSALGSLPNKFAEIHKRSSQLRQPAIRRSFLQQKSAEGSNGENTYFFLSLHALPTFTGKKKTPDRRLQLCTQIQAYTGFELITSAI